jgi:membrane-associated phospholipid phosphatase
MIATVTLRMARAVTEVLAPAVIITALFLGVGWHDAGLRGMLWGLAGAGFASIGPFSVIVIGVLRGRFTDHHLSTREQRAAPLTAAAAMVTAGIVALAAAGAPRDVVAVEAVMLGGLGIIIPVTLFWKVSMHTGVAASVAAVLTMVFGSPALVVWPAVALAGWSRVRLAAHTPAQVAAAAPVGAAVAAVIFGLVR